MVQNEPSRALYAPVDPEPLSWVVSRPWRKKIALRTCRVTGGTRRRRNRASSAITRATTRRPTARSGSMRTDPQSGRGRRADPAPRRSCPSTLRRPPPRPARPSARTDRARNCHWHPWSLDWSDSFRSSSDQRIGGFRQPPRHLPDRPYTTRPMSGPFPYLNRT
jgi:hypothetical protein